MAKTELQSAIATLKISMGCEFVPWSKSRAAKPNPILSDLSLNWKITLRRDGRDILATDYSAGIAHCPSYNQRDAMRPTVHFDETITKETETGRAATGFSKVIAPDLIDVVYSLSMDAEVLEHATFEDWAESFGYDTDSRAAEKTYRACIDIALKLRVGLGDDGLSMLREAAQDY